MPFQLNRLMLCAERACRSTPRPESLPTDRSKLPSRSGNALRCHALRFDQVCRPVGGLDAHVELAALARQVVQLAAQRRHVHRRQGAQLGARGAGAHAVSGRGRQRLEGAAAELEHVAVGDGLGDGLAILEAGGDVGAVDGLDEHAQARDGLAQLGTQRFGLLGGRVALLDERVGAQAGGELADPGG